MNRQLTLLALGLLAFGGPVAQIAMIRRDLVERERWMSGARFNRLLAVMQALPGPEAHELCVHMGMTARGRLGGLSKGPRHGDRHGHAPQCSVELGLVVTAGEGRGHTKPVGFGEIPDSLGVHDQRVLEAT